MIGFIRRYLADRQAARSLVRLYSGEMSEQDQVEMLSRQLSDTTYKDSVIETLETLADMEALSTDRDILGAVGKQQADQPHQPCHSNRWKGAALAASVLISVATVFVVMHSADTQKDGDLQRYVTRTGEQKTIKLADGSALTLNTGTQLLVELSDQSRRVILERGEVYFEVAKDPQKPFVVDLGERSVKVLGTSFNIRKSPDRFKLAVVEGVVAVHHSEAQLSAPASALEEIGNNDRQALRDSAPRKVLAGTVVEYDKKQGTMVAYRDDQIDRLHSWRTGLIHFDEVPLYQVVQELNRYSARKILIEDSVVMGMEVYMGGSHRSGRYGAGTARRIVAHYHRTSFRSHCHYRQAV